MDVFQVMRFILDHLGFDLFQMPEILIYDVRRPSLVRKVGSCLPLSPARRVRFQAGVVGVNSTSSLKECVYHPDCANLGDVGLLEEVSFVNGITMRTDLRDDTSLGPRVSTPDNSAICRITELEDELTKLRQQIATIVLMQEQSLSLDGDCAPGGPQPVMLGQALSLPRTPVHAPLSQPSGAPPPPPPPPPPVQTPKRSALDLLRESRAKAKDLPKQEARPDMSEVLKGIGKVRLRAVERSPGGTPVRRHGVLPQSPVDPASLIAHALRKKFAHRRMFSPDGKSPDKENKSPRFSPRIVASSLIKPSQLRNLQAKRRLSPLAADWQN